MSVVMTEQAALEALATTQELAEDTHRAIRELLEHMRAADEPARPIPLELTSTSPSKTDDSRTRSRSIGLYNPTAATIFVGTDGQRASKSSRAFAAPPTSFVVWPIWAEDVEVAVDQVYEPNAFASGDLAVVLFRFEHVQAAYLGRL